MNGSKKYLMARLFRPIPIKQKQCQTYGDLIIVYGFQAVTSIHEEPCPYPHLGASVAYGEKLPFQVENAPASGFPVATRLELVDKSCCGVSERTTIKWIHSLHFEDSLQLTAGSFKFGLSLIPTLQYSGTPKQLAIFTGRAIQLAQRIGFFRTHEKKATPFQRCLFLSFLETLSIFAVPSV
jgi:hypothetical protein